MDEFVNYFLLILVILPVILFINLWAGIGWELFVNNQAWFAFSRLETRWSKKELSDQSYEFEEFILKDPNKIKFKNVYRYYLLSYLLKINLYEYVNIFDNNNKIC